MGAREACPGMAGPRRNGQQAFAPGPKLRQLHEEQRHRRLGRAARGPVPGIPRLAGRSAKSLPASHPARLRNQDRTEAKGSREAFGDHRRRSDMIGHKAFGLKSLTAELLTTTLIGIALLGPAAAQGFPAGDAPNKEEPSIRAGAMENLLTLLPLLLTSPDRKQLAADLEASIRNGDLKKAENSLNSAIEVGTLAIVLVDHLKDPDLITALQGLGIRGDVHPTPDPTIVDKAAAESCAVPSAPATVNLADMQQALEQEQSYSSRVVQTLTGLMQERNALEARLEKETASQTLTASEMQLALQREQDQRQAAIQELERLREEYGALQAAREQDKASVASNASELDAALRQERERRDNAERQFASAAKKLRDLQAVNEERKASEAARVAELEKALAWARMRSDILTQELVDTTEELQALQEPHRSSATPVV